MKELKAMLLVPMLAIALMGCGSTDTVTTDTTTETTVDSNKTENTDVENTDASDSTDAESTDSSDSTEVSNNTAEDTDTESADTEATGTDNTAEASDTASEGRVILEGGEITDTCLELHKVFIDFKEMDNEALKLKVEKRSEINLVVTVHNGESNQYDIQYSRSSAKVGETKYFDTTFPDGYEYIADPKYGDIYYSVTQEDNGKRIVILQDVGDECYLSIRTFDKTSTNALLIIDEIMVKNLPIYYK